MTRWPPLPPSVSARAPSTPGLIFVCKLPGCPLPPSAALGHPAAGLICAMQAPKPPPPALAALGHPPPLRGGGERVGVFASPTQWGRREHRPFRPERSGGGCLEPAAGLIFAMHAPRPPPPSLAVLGHLPHCVREGRCWVHSYSPQVTPPRMLVTRSASDWPVAKPKSWASSN